MQIERYVGVLVLAAVSLVGCDSNPTQPVNTTPANAANSISNSAPANQQPPANPVAQANAMPVTMPLIDAMLADESFLNEARASVQLTDEETDKIRDTARNAVLRLDADAQGDDARSTRNSVEQTRKDIEKIIGPQRTEQFINLVRTRWGGDAEDLAARPNAIPTDTRVVVNAAAYRMDLFRDGQLVKTYKIGIGYPEFPLPAGVRRAKEIIFNPTWTPPDEPWVKGKYAPGRKVEAGSKLNPLGKIKIPIGLPSLIHGGKNPSRLGTFASHGCVGLTDAMVQDFALQLASLSATQLTAADVKAFEKDKTETKNVVLSQAMPVELRYETIVVENGKVTIYRDVYERGTNTEENLRRVLEVYGVSLESLPEADRTKLLDAVNQMAVDAQGKAVEESENSNRKNTSSKVTKNIKGKKEIAIEIPALQGKGYPAAVNLMSA